MQNLVKEKGKKFVNGEPEREQMPSYFGENIKPIRIKKTLN